MSKDIREVMKGFKEEKLELSNEHEQKFKKKMQEAFSVKKKSYKWCYVAASVVIVLTLGNHFYSTYNRDIPLTSKEDNEQKINLGNISPEMQKIENYYLTAINYEIASLEVTPENKALLDEYLEKINKLDIDYKRLNLKLKKEGINNTTVNALITNLQLRLQLLIQLKDTINELQFKENNDENITI